MLDPCSTGTYVTESAAQQLNLQGQRQSLTISGKGGSEIRKQSARVELTVSSLDGRFSSKVQANVLDNITGDTPAIRWSELKEKWPHLKAIDQAERTLSFKNGRYKIGVSWKRNEPKFSNNYELTFPRLKKL